MTTSLFETTVPPVAEVSEYVLPKPPRPAGEVMVGPGRSGAEFVLRRTAATARELGGRFLLLADCQQQFLAELRHGLEALDGAVAEDARVKLKSAVHAALQVLEWCDTVQGDLQLEGGWAARGWQPIDLGAFCREQVLAAQFQGAPVLVTGEVARVWWGDAERLAAVLHAGLHAVAERTAGLGSIVVEVRCDAAGHRVRIAGTGEPADDLDPAVLQAFRNAVERLGARVVPDSLGGGGAGLVIELPVAAS